MFTKTLNRKILLIMFITAIIPIIAISLANHINTSQAYSELINDQQLTIQNSVTSQLTIASEDLLEISESYASNEQLISALNSDDREQMASVLDGIFQRLKEEHNLEVFEIGDEQGIVFYRAHNPEKFGDDKSGDQAINSALSGESQAGFAFGSSGLNIRAFIPIQSGGQTIGTLQTGLNDVFLQNIIQSLSGVSISLYNDQGESLASTNENIEQITINNDLKKVLTGETITSEDSNYIVTYLPMFEPTQTETIGFVQIKQDISDVSRVIAQNEVIGMVIVLITLVFVIVVSVLFSRGISVPLKQVATNMNEISNGNLLVKDIKYRGKDELKQLSDSVNSMKNNLKEIITNVSKASKNVSNKSEKLTQSAKEVRDGSEQIASTMQELSSGTENQATNSTSLFEVMEDFEAKIQHANNNGNDMANMSTDVLEMTQKGSQLMHQSVSQMKTIDDVVQTSISKVEGLQEQSKKISTLVKVINDIAEQTNLLALNAAIEAARAGEHGKGFAVVADEVRKLAGQASESAQDITSIVSSIQSETGNVVHSLNVGYEEVNKGRNEIELTGQSFEAINESVTEMATKIQEISASLREIANNSHAMKSSIEEIASVSEESAAGVEQVAASAQQSTSSMEEITRNAMELDELAVDLNNHVKRFKL
ncbi:methyl-accepting chemotaxis protein [Bacillus suaedae]|uniref:HAMP domain-containing protein n=1 Tax=Halalkalibacter suaedae TaxID=2822140 RepID=A0A940WZG9_9BACI|nr:methyl-accepting chemotaxis protein [Bacillus suaedae]MBP3951660.1 HAMP domain-containing protein [Bacillus suaedae]